MNLIRLCGLDKHFDLVKTIKYINLQWVRRYYAFGEYSVQIPASQYDERIAYIYTPDRPELGIVQQSVLTQSVFGDLLQLSGYFYEKTLDDKIVWPTMNFSGNIEVGARLMFSKYKADIPATLDVVKGLGSSLQFQETGAELGRRIYELLETQEMSYKIKYDYLESALRFLIYQGKDRSDTQNINSRLTFSRRLGNVLELAHTYDSSNFKNYAIVAGEGEGSARVVTTVDLSGGGYKRILWVDARDLRSDDLTPAQYLAALKQRGLEKLLEHQIIDDFSLEISPLKKGRVYLEDFDLGDKVDVVIDLSTGQKLVYTARITEISEVIKNNNWTVGITVGNKTPTVLQKAMR